MGIPLDGDWNEIRSGAASIEEDMTDANKVTNVGPKEARGGTFAPADIPVIKRALQVYLVDCMRAEGYSDRDPHPDIKSIANLLHRLGRIG